ncbi:MAG: hypothetical protein AAFR61_07990 [Bacteroidota bacterium]
MSLPKFSSKRLYNLFTCLCVLLVFGCDTGRNPGKDVIATYNGEQLLREEIDFFLPDSLGKADSTKYAEQYVEQWISLQAVAEQARREVDGLEDKVAFQLKSYQYQLMAHEFANWLIEDKAIMFRVNEAEIQGYYDRNPEKFVSGRTYYQILYVKTDKPNQYRVANLMNSKDPEKMDELLVWARENATEYRLDSTYVEEAEMDRLSDGYYFGDIRRASRTTTYPYQHKEGDTTYYDFFRLLNVIKPGEALPLNLVREQIIGIIQNQRKNTLISQTESNLVKQAKAAKKAKIMSK